MKKGFGAVLAVLLAPAMALAAPVPVADRAAALVEQAEDGSPPAPVQAEPAAEPPRVERTAPSDIDPNPASPHPGSPVASVANQTPEAQATISGFQLSLDLDHSLGQGTLVDTNYSSSLVGELAIAPSYAFHVKELKLRASASTALDWEYTLPDNENARRFGLRDIRLSLAAPAVFKEKFTGIALTPSIGGSIPISFESRHASTITVLRAGLSLSRTFGNVDLSYKFGAARGFHGSELVVVSRQDSVQNGVAICHVRAGEDSCDPFGWNTQFSISNSVNANWRATEKFSAGIGFSIDNAFRYAASADTVDEFTPSTVNVDGQPVARRVGRSDKVRGSIGASYAFNDNFSLSVGMLTDGPAKTKDGKNFRVPFFDFVSGADNLTSYSLTLSALY